MCSEYLTKPEKPSNEEWLDNYDVTNEVINEHEILFENKLPVDDLEYSLSVKTDYSQIIDGSTHQFRYLDHRTTRTKCVALEFESLDEKFTAVMFCNVQLDSSRGTRYPAGQRGQFIPPERGKFRKLWMKFVAKPPTRWCMVHTKLRSAFKDKVFIGKIERAVSSKGEPYFKIID